MTTFFYCGWQLTRLQEVEVECKSYPKLRTFF
jgi:hypothetical protein